MAPVLSIIVWIVGKGNRNIVIVHGTFPNNLIVTVKFEAVLLLKEKSTYYLLQL